MWMSLPTQKTTAKRWLRLTVYLLPETGVSHLKRLKAGRILGGNTVQLFYITRGTETELEGLSSVPAFSRLGVES